MKLKQIYTTLWLFLYFSITTLIAQDYVEIPTLKSPVTDLTNTLSSGQINLLTNKIKAFEKRKGSQVAVLLLPSTQPETIEQYSIRLADKWQIGRGGQIDDGIILILAKNDRKLRIEVGYGLEGAIPDIYANRIINNIIVPKLKEGNFNSGINEGVDALIHLIDGEELPAVTAENPKVNIDSISNFLPFIFIFGFIVLPMIGNSIKSTPIKIGIAVLGGGLVWLLAAVLSLSIITTVVIFILMNAQGRNGGGGHRGGGGWIGGGGGGWTTGGGGGGWSGGGGGFGGGGSSGSW